MSSGNSKILPQAAHFCLDGIRLVLSPCILRALCTAAFSIKWERAAGCKIINCCTPEKFCANCKKYNYKLFITSSIAKEVHTHIILDMHLLKLSFCSPCGLFLSLCWLFFIVTFLFKVKCNIFSLFRIII